MEMRLIRYTFLPVQYLQQYKKSRTIIMGCGAVCGSSSSVSENLKQAQTLFSSLFKQISANQYLYPPKAIAKFAKQMQLNPHRLQLILTQKLQPKALLPPWVMQKWKIILFGLDCDRAAYVNCLGYPNNALKAKPSTQKQPAQQTSNPNQHNSDQTGQKIELLQHKAFIQIEKDIDRTFPGITFQKKSFKMVLKRISNHFPVMGYTQGINFVVGYLLIVGFSESDAFWLFVHLAINRRYMLLGLYEDGFPLIYVYTSIFRSLLKRTNLKLYKHLYQSIVMFEQSAWVFKWFMTCYLSSFPLQMCQYVWDMVLSVGAIGLVKFGISLVTSLQPHLYEYDDACDISQFLSSLRELQTFNKYVNIRQVIKSSYKIEIKRQDLDSLTQIKTQAGQPNFYAQYLIFRFEEQQNNKQKKQQNMQNQVKQNQRIIKNVATEELHQSDPILFRKLSARRSSQLLDSWYGRLTRQRTQFRETSRENSRKKSIVIQNFQSSGEVIFQPITQLVLPPIQLLQIPTAHNIHRQSQTSIQQFGSIQGISFSQQKPQQQPRKQSADNIQVSPSNKMKISTNRYKRTKKQDLMWKEDDEQQEIQEIKDQMMAMDDQFMYIPKDIRFKRKNVSHQAHQADDILSEYINPTKPKQSKNRYILKHTKSLKPEAYTEENSGSNGNSRLAKVGNSVVNSNMSVSNASNRSSTSSYRTVHKQNAITINTRQCKCIKNKTEQNHIQTIIAIPRKKAQKIQQPEEIMDHEQSVDHVAFPRKRLNTYQDWMVNSQGPRQNANLQSSNIKQTSEICSQVQIIQNNLMFKKKNRINKVSGCQIHPHHYRQQMIQHQISEVQSRGAPTPGLQESSESFIIGNISSRRSQFGEIESVK